MKDEEKIEKKDTLQDETENKKEQKEEKKDCIIDPKQHELDELNDRYKRVLAEFENYKKRSSKERETLYNSILGDIVGVFLPVVDNLENALKAETKDSEYKKGIDAVSTDENILNASGMCNGHKVYFKNLMYRIVLNGGSHKEEQVQSMELDFLSLISEKEKRRTAQEILCFIYLLNKSHMLAHLGDVEATLNAWCETIKNRSVIP